MRLRTPVSLSGARRFFVTKMWKDGFRGKAVFDMERWKWVGNIVQAFALAPC